MQAALRAAEELRSASAADAAEAERGLSDRAEAVRHALSLLGDAGTVSLKADPKVGGDDREHREEQAPNRIGRRH
jgi:hypothetical protein